MSSYEYLSAFGRSFFVAFAAVLPILNPPSVTGIFWTLTKGASDELRLDFARRIATNVGLMLIASLVAGNFVLSFFGISLAAVRVGGGLLVLYNGWRLVNSTDPEAGRSPDAVQALTPEIVRQRAFYPLTFPISCGPGSISTAITVGAALRAHDQPLTSAAHFAGAVPGLMMVAFVLYLCLRYAEGLLGRLGSNGTAVFMRLSAFILMCIGVQICWEGARELLLELLRAYHQYNNAPVPQP
jgi:multiple antibiotic resistance protein